MPVSRAAVNRLIKAFGLTEEQAAVTRRLLLTTKERWTSEQSATKVGISLQYLRRFRQNLTEDLAAGRPPGSNSFIPHLEPVVGRVYYYEAAAVLLWGMQTERLLHDGSINENRGRPGKAVGSRPGTRGENLTRKSEEEVEAERLAVLTAYRDCRRKGQNDSDARDGAAKHVGMSRQKVSAYLTKISKQPEKYGPLFEE